MQILPFQELLSLETAIFMSKLSTNLLPKALNEYFTLNCSIHNYNTRNARNTHLPLNRTPTLQSSLFDYGPVLWNSLQPQFKNSKTVKQFKRLYKKHLLNS